MPTKLVISGKLCTTSDDLMFNDQDTSIKFNGRWQHWGTGGDAGIHTSDPSGIGASGYSRFWTARWTGAKFEYRDHSVFDVAAMFPESSAQRPDCDVVFAGSLESSNGSIVCGPIWARNASGLVVAGGNTFALLRVNQNDGSLDRIAYVDDLRTLEPQWTSAFGTGPAAPSVGMFDRFTGDLYIAGPAVSTNPDRFLIARWSTNGGTVAPYRVGPVPNIPDVTGFFVGPNLVQCRPGGPYWALSSGRLLDQALGDVDDGPNNFNVFDGDAGTYTWIQVDDGVVTGTQTDSTNLTTLENLPLSGAYCTVGDHPRTVFAYQRSYPYTTDDTSYYVYVPDLDVYFKSPTGGAPNGLWKVGDSVFLSVGSSGFSIYGLALPPTIDLDSRRTRFYMKRRSC